MGEQTAKFDGWAIVEVMGRQTFVGKVTTESYGAAVLFRVDVPELPEREMVTRAGRYDSDNTYIPSGSKVKAEKVQGYTKLIGSTSIYAMTPCTEAAAMEALERLQPQPVTLIDRPPKSLPAPVDEDEIEGEFDEDDGPF